MLHVVYRSTQLLQVMIGRLAMLLALLLSSFDQVSRTGQAAMGRRVLADMHCAASICYRSMVAATLCNSHIGSCRVLLRRLAAVARSVCA